MVDGDGFGLNWAGRYDPELMDYYRRARRKRADQLPEAVKTAILAGRHVLDAHGGRYYAMAQNLALELTAAYDAALAAVDAIVLPTIVTTAPFDVTGHPATSVPAGLVNGLPAGLMIVGRKFGDETCLRVARAFEMTVGGFQAPPFEAPHIQSPPR